MSQDNSTKVVKVCEFGGCGRDVKSKNETLCGGHYRQRQRRKSLTPLFIRKRPDGSPPRIEYAERPCPKPWLKGPCHIWERSKDGKGYGKVWDGKRLVQVHVYRWELIYGSVSEDFELDHQCEVKACCNPDHLREVTHQVNMTENNRGPTGINAAKTHCKRGHEFTEENTYRSKGKRSCRECRRQRENI